LGFCERELAPIPGFLSELAGAHLCAAGDAVLRTGAHLQGRRGAGEEEVEEADDDDDDEDEAHLFMDDDSGGH